LLKIKILDTCPEDRKTAGIIIAERTFSHLVQVLGRTLLLYRRSDTPEIILPQ
jgi:RNA-binding protein